ncbi:MAG: hypothetical protein U0795_27190 [Pirellulales bacterium]
MPKLQDADELTPLQRRSEIAAILAAGILRLRSINRSMGRMDNIDTRLSNSESGGLEESRQRPLSVNSG